MFPTIKTFDERLATKREVIGLEHGGAHRAYPVDDLTASGAVNDDIGGAPVVLVADGNGAVDVFHREVHGQPREFQPADGAFRDVSGTVYDLRGRAFSGPEAGTQLEPFAHSSRVLWIIWSNFHPETELAGAG